MVSLNDAGLNYQIGHSRRATSHPVSNSSSYRLIRALTLLLLINFIGVLINFVRGWLALGRRRLSLLRFKLHLILQSHARFGVLLRIAPNRADDPDRAAPVVIRL